MYKVLDNELVREYVDKTPELRSLLLENNEPASLLEISEIGDGNLNFVYTVKKDDKSLVIKQAVPYLRCVGEEYPLSRIRMTFEIEALKKEKEICPQFVPDIYHSSHEMSLVAMQNLNKHKILRGEMIKRKVFPKLAEHIAIFLADTLFYTSDFYLSPKEKKELVKKFINIELCKITEDFIFTHPYEENETNSYSPKLDMSVVKNFRQSKDIKVAVAKLRYKFMTEAQALLHGDLHTGSIMLNEEETYVIDPEFAFYGPMGFDVGIYLANLAMSYISCDKDEKDYKEYVESLIKDTWKIFSKRFKANMINHEKEVKSLQWDYPEGLKHFELFCDDFINSLFDDSVGFMACEMFRRTVGLAKVADIADIKDEEKRANKEKNILECAGKLVTNKYKNIDEVIQEIKKYDR